MATNKNDYTAIKSFEDAMAATGRPDVPDLSGFPEDMREYFEAQYKALVITEAVNQGEKKLDWANNTQCKHFPWFVYRPSWGFAFFGATWRNSDAYAGVASRLCLADDERARYVGENFTAIHDAILRK